MIIEYIRYKLNNEENCAAFEQAYLSAEKILARSEHYRSMELSRCDEASLEYTVRIEWDSMTGHVEGFRRSPLFPDFFGLVRPFFEQILEMRHYQVRFSKYKP